MRLHLLGQPDLIDDAGRSVSVSGKGLTLLAALVWAPSGMSSRSALASLLYPETVGTDASGAFRQLVRRLSRAVGEEVMGHDTRRLWAGPAIRESDLARLLKTSRLADSDAMLKFATSFAPLLDEVNFEERELQTWLDDRRRRVAEQARQLVVEAARAFAGPAATQALQAIARTLPDDAIIGEALVRAMAGENRSAVQLQQRQLPPGPMASILGKTAWEARIPATGADAAVLPAFRPAAPGGVPRIVLLRPKKATFSAVNRRVLSEVDSLVEDLSIDLASAREVGVVAPHTAWQITDGRHGASAFLDVIEFVLHTRVRASNSGMTISLSLGRTGSQEVIWAEQVELAEGEGIDPLRIKSIIITMIGSIERSELAILRSTGKSTAYRYYLMGRQHLRTLTLPDVRRARRWFRGAIEIDPYFARAHSWTAHTLVLEWVMMTGKDPELLRAADLAARHALDLDPNDANGYRALARSALFRGALDQSLAWFAEAEHYAPHFADMLADYADTLVHNSMADEAVEKMELALHLNPIPPDTYLWIAAGADFLRADFEAALSKLKHMSNQDQGYRLMAASAAMLGDQVAARTYRHAALSIDPAFKISEWIQRLPLKEAHHLELYVSALKKAGFR